MNAEGAAVKMHLDVTMYHLTWIITWNLIAMSYHSYISAFLVSTSALETFFRCRFLLFVLHFLSSVVICQENDGGEIRIGYPRCSQTIPL